MGSQGARSKPRLRPGADLARGRGGAGGAPAGTHKGLPAPASPLPTITFCSTEASPMMRGVWKLRAMPLPRAAPAGPQAAAPPGTCRRRPNRAGDHVQGGGLAAAVRPDQACTGPAHVQVQAVDRAHAAEGQHDARRESVWRRRSLRSRLPTASGRGTMLRSRASGRRGKSSSAAMPPGAASTITSSSTAYKNVDQAASGAAISGRMVRTRCRAAARGWSRARRSGWR